MRGLRRAGGAPIESCRTKITLSQEPPIKLGDSLLVPRKSQLLGFLDCRSGHRSPISACGCKLEAHLEAALIAARENPAVETGTNVICGAHPVRNNHRHAMEHRFANNEAEAVESGRQH